MQVACIFILLFYVPSTARSFRDGIPINRPLRRTWSSVFTLFPPRIEPRAVPWKSITLPLRHASSQLVEFDKVCYSSDIIISIDIIYLSFAILESIIIEISCNFLQPYHKLNSNEYTLFPFLNFPGIADRIQFKGSRYLCKIVFHNSNRMLFQVTF